MEIVRKGQDMERPPFRTSIRPVCVECNCEMQCMKNGAHVHLVKSDAYAIGDMYTCMSCGKSTVTGWASHAVHYINTPENIVARIDT